MNHRNSKGRGVLTPLIIVSLVFCCLSPIIYLVGMSIDRAICYPRISERLGTSSNRLDIDNKLVGLIKEKLKPGTNYDDAIKNLNEIAPVVIMDRYEGLDGDFGEFVYLDFCFFTRNGFSYMLSFSKEKKFEDFWKYIDD
jgi:hypothetical protein